MKMIKSAFIGTLMVPAFMLAAGTASAEENTATTTSTAEATYMTSAPAGTFYADSLTGNNVQSSVEDDENIGTINDLIINEDGQIEAVIVGVGGFLGMGEKDVAIEWDSLELTQNADNDEYEIRVNASQEALEEAEEFDRDAGDNLEANNN
ncbi:PRC-barrel domain-containing protein [Vreelandella zhanjiangensis]|uniref:PRC-barrel domain-containing protein n=1 Tax=Vreelandella zhanjiangensis TaxID=1121960 RepID=UPI00037C5C40|nr:PRC-barrel domain-containing protein [Halomonas zhanjiangensis]